MNWKFFGEWADKRYPAKKSSMIPKKIWNRLCDKDKELLLEDEKYSNIFVFSFFFWMAILFMVALTFNWVLG